MKRYAIIHKIDTENGAKCKQVEQNVQHNAPPFHSLYYYKMYMFMFIGTARRLMAAAEPAFSDESLMRAPSL
jgi:hypothetical protein